jgi:CelD/BcsL family acetyltransferase involved in cellulose biosynthesis
MPVFELDPLRDARWSLFVDSHPHSSIFHTPQWLEALRKTYGYRPVAFTTCAPGTALTNGIVFCEANSWLTGSRWVSLPFSDHCEPLVDSPSTLPAMLSEIAGRKPVSIKFAEVRPRSAELTSLAGWTAYAQYWLHILDLQPGLEQLYSHLHKDSIQRKIRRAEREGVVIEQGRSEVFLRDFYNLMVLTRRRHRVPPQPLAWFRNLAACFQSQLTVRVARVGGRPIASIMTLRHKNTVTYKYGCSDEQYHPLGGMARLFWETIQEAKAEGLVELDLGRSDLDNEGLARFKDHLGAAKATVKYWRFGQDSDRPAGLARRTLKSSLVQTVLARLPTPLFRLAGAVLYRHAG